MPEELKEVRMSVSVPADIHAILVRLAKSDGRSLTRYAAKILTTQAIKASKE